MTDRLTRITTALAVLMVVGVAAVISYQHQLVRSHGETGVTARLLPFTVDGLIWAASMVVLDSSRRNRAVPRLALLSPCQGLTDLPEHTAQVRGVWCKRQMCDDRMVA